MPDHDNASENEHLEASQDAEDAPLRELSRKQRDIAVIGWCSFLVAAVATMFFFAWIDPLTLIESAQPPISVDIMGGYAIGFFFFWALSAASAALTVYLIRTRRGHPSVDE